MPGVKIAHPTERSRLVLVADVARRLPFPTLCPRLDCGLVHEFKTYHLDLDDVGQVIVSETVFDALKRSQAVPTVFQVVGEVKHPPELVVAHGVTRPAMDASNRRIDILGST